MSKKWLLAFFPKQTKHNFEVEFSTYSKKLQAKGVIGVVYIIKNVYSTLLMHPPAL